MSVDSDGTDGRHAVSHVGVYGYADLVAAAGLACAGAAAVVHPSTAGTPVAIALGLPVVLLWPGYAIVAALYPERGALSDGIDGAAGGLERLVLSVGSSLAASPLVALAANYTAWGIRPEPVFAGLAGVTCAASGVAALRRRELQVDRRYVPPVRTAIAAVTADAVPERPIEAVLLVVLAVAVLVSAASVGYLGATPRHGESFTEFYLVTSDGTGGYVAADYPTSFRTGESQSLVVGVRNREHRPVTYTVVLLLQRVDPMVGADNASTATTGVAAGAAPSSGVGPTGRVLERTELRRFENVQLDHGETWQRRHEVAPRTTGRNLRLTYLLYRGRPPAEPTIGNAAYETHLWIDVRPAGTGTTVAPGTPPANRNRSTGAG
jgi:uncharacterized membrane protein